MTSTAHIDTFVIDGLPVPDRWPELLLDDPLYQYPDRLNAATELLDSAIDKGWGDRPCVALGDTRWTYSELLGWSNRLANALVDEGGLVPGNRVLLRGPNAPWMVAAFYAILKAGGVAVITMPMLREPELKKIYNKCSPSLALCAAGMEEPLVTLAGDSMMSWGEGSDLMALLAAKSDQFTNVDTAADDPALLGFTSGTTGEPKAAIHFHRDFLVVADAFQPVLKATSDDVFCGSPPLAFTFGLGGEVIFPMRIGAAAEFCPAPGPGPLAELIAERGATVIFTAPTAYKAMLEIDGADLSGIRRAVSAGETLPLAVYEDFLARTGVKLIDGIGATEMLHIFIACSDGDIRPGATGKPLPGYEGCRLDDDGNEVPDGTVGKLAVRGPIGCRYLEDDRQSDYVSNGWNLTGDAFSRDSDGYFYYQARTDDMIVSSGYNIGAPEVEEALVLHEAVAEVGVIGVPDPDRGSVIKAFVYLKDPSSASDELRVELQDFVKATIAPYKYPRQLVFLDEPLPRTNTGKLQRFALKSL